MADQESCNTVLVYEPDVSGHRIFYLVHVVEALREAGQQVLIGTTPEAFRAAAVHSQVLADLGSKFWVIKPYRAERGRAASGSFAAMRLRRQHFEDTVKHARLDHLVNKVFVCFLDGLWTALLMSRTASRLRIVLSGIVMRCEFGHIAAGVPGAVPSFKISAKFVLFSLFLRIRNVDAIFSIDPTIKASFRTASSAGRKLSYIVDPANFDEHDKQAARAQFSIPRDAHVVLCFGALTARKRIPLLLQAAALDPLVTVFLGGQCSTEVRALLETATARNLRDAGRLFVIDRFVSDSEENYAYSACDAVWLNYTDHRHMSGVLVKAALARRLVVGCDYGLIGWHLRLGLGVLVKRQTPVDAAAAIRQALELSHENWRLVDAAHTYFKTYTVQNFKETLRLFFIKRSR